MQFLRIKLTLYKAIAWTFLFVLLSNYLVNVNKDGMSACFNRTIAVDRRGGGTKPWAERESLSVGGEGVTMTPTLSTASHKKM